MPDFASIRHRDVTTNSVRLHIAELGEGPLVLLLHGFPESAYSWRHQIVALAEAGYHVVAPDQRGYGRSECPEAVDQFTIMHLVGDVVGLISALGEESAIVVGHDFGAPVAWATALLRPDLVRGVVGMSVPPSGAFLPIQHERVSPVTSYREKFGDSFYVVAFQEPGIADGMLNTDISGSLRGMWAGAETDEGRDAEFDDDHRPSDRTLPLPAWASEEDLAVYTEEYREHGFTGGLNWYRNLDRNWQLLAPWRGAVITPPSLYVIGDRDNVSAFITTPDSLDALRVTAPGARGIVTVPDCGHWTQQTQPDFVSKQLVEFAGSLD